MFRFAVGDNEKTGKPVVLIHGHAYDLEQFAKMVQGAAKADVGPFEIEVYRVEPGGLWNDKHP